MTRGLGIDKAHTSVGATGNHHAVTHHDGGIKTGRKLFPRSISAGIDAINHAHR